MQVGHGGLDVGVSQKPLNGMDGGSGFEQVGREGVPEGVDGGIRDAEFFAGNDQESLEGADRHGFGGFVHAAQKVLTVRVASSCIGEKKPGVFVVFPIRAEVVEHRRRQGDHAVFVALAAANPEFALFAVDVFDGERKAFGKAQPATVDEFDGNAVTAQADGAQEGVDLLAGEDMRERGGILGFDLRKDAPVVLAEDVGEEEFGDGNGLAYGFGHPMLDGLDIEDVVAELVFGERNWIAPEMITQEAYGSVIRITGARSFSVQS